MKRNKLIAILCLTALLASSCQSENKEIKEPSDTPEVSSELQSDIPSSIASLPVCDETREINILNTVHAEYEFGSEELVGDVVNDAVFARNTTVEELLNVTLKYENRAGHWADRDSFNSIVSQSVMAGDGEYDLVNGVMVCVMPTVTNGIYLNMYDVPNINIENPWWVDGLATQATIGGKLFALTGDSQLSFYKDQSCIYFNRNIVDELNYEDPYDLVRSGEWTLDKMITMALGAASDLNGDGEIIFEDDRLGYIAPLTPNRALQASCGLSLFKSDNNGNIEFTGLSEKYVDAYQKLYDFFERNSGTEVLNSNEKAINTFNEGRTLFLTYFLSVTESIRDMEDDFGIIPLPKYDTEQDRYYTRIGTSTSMFFIPKTAKYPETVGAVCEALAYYGQKDVIPTWYNVALKEKYTREEDTKEMVDLIRQSAELAFDCVYAQNLSEATSAYFAFWDVSHNVGENVTSYVESRSEKLKTELAELSETIKNMD